MAGNARFTRLLLGLGLRRFSMPPPALLEVKGIIRESDPRRLGAETDAIMRCGTPEELRVRIDNLNE